MIAPEICIDFYKFDGPLVYAIKKSDFDPDQVNKDTKSYFESNPDLIPSDVQIRMVATVNRNDPAHKIVDVLEIAGVSQDHLKIEKARAIYTFTDGTSQEQAYGGQEYRPDHSREFTPAPSYRPGDTGEPGTFRWFTALWYVVIPITALIAIVAILVVRKFKK